MELFIVRHRMVQIFNQRCLSDEPRPVALQGLYDSMGHMRTERTVDLANARYYLPEDDAIGGNKGEDL
jgi:hypothetical protein